MCTTSQLSPVLWSKVRLNWFIGPQVNVIWRSEICELLEFRGKNGKKLREGVKVSEVRILCLQYFFFIHLLCHAEKIITINPG